MNINPLNTTIIDGFPIDFEEDLKKEIKSVAKQYSVPSGDIIMDIEQTIKHIPLVLKGSIKILREDDEGNEIFLYYLEPGNACATSITCCATGQKSTIRAMAEDDTEYLAIPVQYSDEWMYKYKSWKKFVMNTYAERFEELLKAIDQLAFKKWTNGWPNTYATKPTCMKAAKYTSHTRKSPTTSTPRGRWSPAC